MIELAAQIALGFAVNNNEELAHEFRKYGMELAANEISKELAKIVIDNMNTKGE